MGQTRKVEPVKLFIGLIVSEEKLADDVQKLLQKSFGSIDVSTRLVSFDFTDYYAPEMGTHLLRKWVSFKKLIAPDMLVKIKLKTNRIEKKFSQAGQRTVNIDPGYLALSKVILASTKDFSHRIYLSGGIFAEITLQYRQKKFVDLPWTYPDYKSETAVKFFEETRSAYHDQIK